MSAGDVKAEIRPENRCKGRTRARKRVRIATKDQKKPIAASSEKRGANFGRYFSSLLGPKEEAEKALVAIFEWSNKGLAHLTTGVLSDNYTGQHLDISCRGIPALLHNHLYAKLGKEVPKPPSAVPSQRR